MLGGSGRNHGGSNRVRIFPGSSISSLTTPPPPPSSPPPKPAHICKIAVLGDAFSGKSSLVQKFIFRQYANSRCVNNYGDVCNDNANPNGAESAASISVGTSLGAASFERCELTLADYHKKDVTVWDHVKQQNGEPLKPMPLCIRVQCWDINIHRHHLSDQQTEPDNSSCSHSIISESSPRNSTNILPLLPLIKKMNGIIIVCRSPLSPSYTSHSSNASFSSHTSNTYSEWPELDSLEEQIRRWTSFLQRKEVDWEYQHNTAFVFLSCADLAIVDYSPREWMQLSVRMQDICEVCGIDSWNMGTCIDTSSLFDADFLKNNQSLLLEQMLQQQSRQLEDMEDAIERALIDVILIHLGRARKLQQ
jgi:GTPase SAR1 family protein